MSTTTNSRRPVLSVLRRLVSLLLIIGLLAFVHAHPSIYNGIFSGWKALTSLAILIVFVSYTVIAFAFFKRVLMGIWGGAIAIMTIFGSSLVKNVHGAALNLLWIIPLLIVLVCMNILNRRPQVLNKLRRLNIRIPRIQFGSSTPTGNASNTNSGPTAAPNSGSRFGH